jgi:hypothetical protein
MTGPITLASISAYPASDAARVRGVDEALTKSRQARQDEGRLVATTIVRARIGVRRRPGDRGPSRDGVLFRSANRSPRRGWLTQ